VDKAVEKPGMGRVRGSRKAHSPPWWVTWSRGVEAAGLERCYDQDLVGGDVAGLGIE
jgi:hypothetical protein